MGAIMILGLLRTTSFETSVMLAGLRPPQQEALLRLMTLKDQVERIGMVLEESKIKTHLSPKDIVFLTIKRTEKVVKIEDTANPGCLWKALHKYIDFRIDAEWTNATNGNKLRKLDMKEWFRHYDRALTSKMGQFLSGHVPTNKYLHRIGRSETQQCRLCQQQRETRRHLVFHCKKTAHLREKCFDKSFLEKSEMKFSRNTLSSLAKWITFMMPLFKNQELQTHELKLI